MQERLRDMDGNPISRYEIFIDGEFHTAVNKPDSWEKGEREFIESLNKIEDKPRSLKVIKMYE